MKKEIDHTNKTKSKAGNPETPLVSIVVITYNSSKYVLETLESAKAQLYQNIELIISDDCSMDKTVAICKNWLKENKSFFVRTLLIEVEKNTGISPNLNRGLNSANGIWIKPIAGDDILLPNCISDYVQFVNKNEAIKFAVSFADNKIERDYMVHDVKPSTKSFLTSFSNYNSKNQLKYYLSNLDKAPIPASTFFINKNQLVHLGGYDENYPMSSDLPLLIQFLNNDNKIYVLNNATTIYRKNSDSITSGNTENLININLFNDRKNYFNNVLFPIIIKNNKFLIYLHFKLYFFIYSKVVSRGNTKENFSFVLKFLFQFSPIVFKENLKALFKLVNE